jgi:hypothetical protein
LTSTKSASRTVSKEGMVNGILLKVNETIPSC